MAKEEKDTVYTSETETKETEAKVADAKERETVTRSGAEPRRSAKPSVVKKGAATGKRKTAIARVRLVPGKGEFKINGKSLEEYFPNKVHQQIIGTPFAVTGLTGKFDVFARLNGGGASGQAGALRLGIARSLNEIDRTANRAVLKSKSLLTRDDRIVERKKAGLKKARKASQFSKR